MGACSLGFSLIFCASEGQALESCRIASKRISPTNGHPRVPSFKFEQPDLLTKDCPFLSIFRADSASMIFSGVFFE